MAGDALAHSGGPEQFLAAMNVAANAPDWTGDHMRLRVQSPFLFRCEPGSQVAQECLKRPNAVRLDQGANLRD